MAEEKKTPDATGEAEDTASGKEETTSSATEPTDSMENTSAEEKSTSSDDEHHHHHHQSSGSHHKHRKSSRHKSKNRKKEKSPIKTVVDWFDKNMGGKHLLKSNLLILLLNGVLIAGIFLAGMYIEKSSASDQGDDEPSESYDAIAGGNSLAVSIPTYWTDTIEEKTAVVNALQSEGGINAISFVWASDPHIPDNHSARTEHLGKLMARMLNDCDIPFAVVSGDIGTRASLSTEENLMDMQKLIGQHLAPLWGSDRLLVAVGNHDGVWGTNPNGDGATGYYCNQVPSEQLWNGYFRWQTLDPRRVFSEDGLYFYVDHAAQKTRFIVLNSQFGGEYSEDENGWAVNNRFRTSCYGQAQLDWLADVALDMPEGYGAVITTHVPPRVLEGATLPYTVDSSQLNGIINAYCNKTTFHGSYTDGVEGWSNSTVSVDFTDARGEIIALFAGHVHQDTVDTTTLECPIITIISAGAPVNYGESPERVFQTDTETSFDVVTINRKTRTIYCTRVGAGKDRVISY